MSVMVESENNGLGSVMKVVLRQDLPKPYVSSADHVLARFPSFSVNLMLCEEHHYLHDRENVSKVWIRTIKLSTTTQDHYHLPKVINLDRYSERQRP
jgi:hypothetical protein